MIILHLLWNNYNYNSVFNIKPMKPICVIAARGGSKGVPKKNIRPLLKKPLIAHTIRTAKKWGKKKKIICLRVNRLLLSITVIQWYVKQENTE